MTVTTLPVKARTRWDRTRAALEVAGKVVLFWWHETFGHHDPRVRGQKFLRGRRLLSLECHCGAEWDDIEAGEELGS